MFFTAPQNDVISVSSLNRMARDLLESGLPPMWIGGEISNLTLAASGHAYFSLKDGGAQVRCVMFRGKVSQLPFRPAEGMQVELKGTVTLYEARGDFQINVDQMRSAGLAACTRPLKSSRPSCKPRACSIPRTSAPCLRTQPPSASSPLPPPPRCATWSAPCAGACPASR